MGQRPKVASESRPPGDTAFTSGSEPRERAHTSDDEFSDCVLSDLMKRISIMIVQNELEDYHE